MYPSYQTWMSNAPKLKGTQRKPPPSMKRQKGEQRIKQVLHSMREWTESFTWGWLGKCREKTQESVGDSSWWLFLHGVILCQYTTLCRKRSASSLWVNCVTRPSHHLAAHSGEGIIPENTHPSWLEDEHNSGRMPSLFRQAIQSTASLKNIRNLSIPSRLSFPRLTTFQVSAKKYSAQLMQLTIVTNVWKN